VPLTAPLAAQDRDVFGLLTDPVAAGLGLLAQSPPLWGDRLEWAELVASLRTFEDRWGSAARSATWSLLALYGLCPHAPRARLSRMGGAWVACLRGHRVVDVDATAISLVTRTAARLRIFRGEPDQGAVLAWALVSR
jgi:hypothetical protein